MNVIGLKLLVQPTGAVDCAQYRAPEAYSKASL